MNFGGRLREMRKEKGLTLREVAERAGIDFTYLSKMENDRISYTLPSLPPYGDLSSASRQDFRMTVEGFADRGRGGYLEESFPR
jgi:transcriptional regulator with XRE-family HTH domain